jgi:hypothetical protein
VLDLHSAGSDSSRGDDVAFSCCTNALVISFTAVSRAAGLLLCSNSSFATTMFSMGVALTSSRFLSTYGGFLIYILARVSAVGTVNSRFCTSYGSPPSFIWFWMRVTYFSSMFLARFSVS